MSFSYKASITVDHNKVSSTDQTNFPILISGTYAGAAGVPDLRSTGNGGKVQSSSGYDIYFYSDSALTTRIPAERETYNSSTGAINFWVKKTVLTASDVVIYIAYGDSGIASDPNSDGTYGKTSVWDTNYKAVYHLPDGSSLTANDSTGVNNGTVFGTTTAATGKIDGGAQIDTVAGGATQGIDIASNASLNLTGAMTLSAWINTSLSGMIIGGYQTSASFAGYAIIVGYPTANKVGFYTNNDSNGTGGWRAGATTVNNGAWHYITATLDATGANKKIYVDGVQDFSASNAGFGGSVSVTRTIGNDDTRTSNGFGGILDEVRISNTDRPVAWILTEYNNQNSPSTFYTMGSETSVSTLISRDAYTNGGSVTSTSLTYSHTCTGSNLLLLVQCSCLGGDAVTGVTYNSVAMTQLKKQSDTGVSQTTYIYGLLSPATGSHSVVVSTNASVLMASNAASYINVSQSNLPDASNSVENNTATSTTLSVTTVADNCWAFLAANNGAGGSFVASTNSTLLANNTTGFCDSFDNGTVAPITPAGSFSMTVTSALSNHRIAMVSFAPVGTTAAASFTRKRMLVGIGQ